MATFHATPNRPVGVLGAGAMGSLIAASLAAAGEPVVLFARESPHVAAIVRSGILLVEPDGHCRRVALSIATDPDPARDIRALIVLVKTWATSDALSALAPMLPPDALVVTLQNGLGNRETMLAACPRQDPALIVSGVTSEAALIPDAGTVLHTGHGSTSIGFESASRAAVQSLCASLGAAGLPSTPDPAIRNAVWRKLAINAAINGVTALAGVENGRIATDAQLRGIALRAGQEAASVARSERAEPGDIERGILDVARSTARNRSSMLRDIEEGRRTEWASIYGEIVRLAGVHHLDAPVCETLGALVSARERAVIATDISEELA